jgi:hypothetical protein
MVLGKGSMIAGFEDGLLDIAAGKSVSLDLTFFHGICKIVFAVFTLHRDACNKICKTLSVVRFM